MISIICVWIIFTFIFLGLSIYHFVLSKKKVAELNKTTMSSGRVEILGLDINKFANGVNSFVDDYNASTTKQNRIAAAGYLLAALVAIFSLVLGIVSNT